MWTASVALAGSDGTFNSTGEAMFCNPEGEIVKQGNNTADEVFACETICGDAKEKRECWGVENSLYQFGHRGYVAVEDGAWDCPYTYMQDVTKGQYKQHGEENVKVVDGTGCGFNSPTAQYTAD